MSTKRERLENLLPEWRKYINISEFQDYILQLIEKTPEDEINNFIRLYKEAGKGWGFHSFSSFVVKVITPLMQLMLKHFLTLEGMENLEQALINLKNEDFKRLVIVSNHLSYADTNVLYSFTYNTFSNHGFKDEFSVVVGPKVFAHPYRRFSAMQFNTLLIAQSASVASKEFQYSSREIAKATLKVISDIKKMVKILFVFPEGSRSRDTKLKQFLSGVSRLIYTDEKVLLLPVGIVGTENFLPIGKEYLSPCRIDISIGDPIDLKKEFPSLEDKQEFMDFIGKNVAKLLPKERRGFYL